jgi:hypothetical protein
VSSLERIIKGEIVGSLSMLAVDLFLQCFFHAGASREREIKRKKKKLLR